MIPSARLIGTGSRVRTVHQTRALLGRTTIWTDVEGADCRVG
jgi:hypothetical protein